MTLRVERFVNGVYKQNCYAVGDGCGSALLIDPGSDADGVIALLDRLEWTPLAILATHAHFDHISSVSALMGRYQIPFYLHPADRDLLKRVNLYKFIIEGAAARTVQVPDITNEISDGLHELNFGEFQVNILRTPGHTSGGVCFRIESHLFVGDTVLPNGIGRIDLPGGNAAAMAASLEIIEALPGDLSACPGHGAIMPLISLLQSARAARKNI